MRSSSALTICAFLAGFIAAAFLIGSFGCNRGGGTLATVNGEAVPMDEFTTFLQTKPEVRVITENGSATLPVDGTLGFQALQDMIGQRILLKIAKQEGVEPKADDVQKEIEFQRQLRPNFMASLTQRGLTLEQIKRGITIDLAKERLVTKGITISDKEVDAYIKGHPSEFIDPARAEMLWVFVKTEKGRKQVDKDLGSGQSFSTVAMRYSEYPGARSNAGKFRDPSGNSPAISALPPALQAEVKRTPEQRSTGWMKLLDGWAKFYIERKTENKSIAVTPQMRQAYKRRLALERGSKTRDLQKQILGALKEAKIEIQPKAYRDAWKQAFDKFVQQDKADVPRGTSGVK